MLLDYAVMYPNAIIIYNAIYMALHIYSDMEYLTIPEARSCYAGYFYLVYWTLPSPIKHNPKRNGPIHIECKTIRNVLSSADDSETCVTFSTGETAI